MFGVQLTPDPSFFKVWLTQAFHTEFGLFSQDLCFISGSVITVLINKLIYDLCTCLKYKKYRKFIYNI